MLTHCLDVLFVEILLIIQLASLSTLVGNLVNVKVETVSCQRSHQASPVTKLRSKSPNLKT